MAISIFFTTNSHVTVEETDITISCDLSTSLKANTNNDRQLNKTDKKEHYFTEIKIFIVNSRDFNGIYPPSKKTTNIIRVFETIY